MQHTRRTARTKRARLKLILGRRISLNKRGSATFAVNKDVSRTGASTWKVRSRSNPRTFYLIYVETEVDRVGGYAARCECRVFLFNGDCGHINYIMPLEIAFRKRHKRIFIREVERRIQRGPVRINPYA